MVSTWNKSNFEGERKSRVSRDISANRRKWITLVQKYHYSVELILLPMSLFWQIPINITGFTTVLTFKSAKSEWLKLWRSKFSPRSDLGYIGNQNFKLRKLIGNVNQINLLSINAWKSNSSIAVCHLQKSTVLPELKLVNIP
jgi:hypothetical protein